MYEMKSNCSVDSGNESISGQVSFCGGRTRLDSSAPGGARGSEAWLDSWDEEQQQEDQGSSEEEEKEEDVEHPGRWTNAKPLAVGGGVQASSGGGGGAASLGTALQQPTFRGFVYERTPPQSPVQNSTGVMTRRAVTL
jgi:hypothetical protein